MKKLLTILALFFTFMVSAQSETHDFVTYDTLIGTYDGTAWRARISRPFDYFTPNHPDTTSRPLIITMPGAGQVGTNYAYLQIYGPHYWLNNGWDGGVVLSNGTHYPLLITVMPSAVNPRIGSFIKMLQALFTKFHPKSDSRHFAGLSMGAFTIAGMINGQLTGGGEEGMQLANSITLLQGDGQGATSGIMGTATPYHATNYSAFGHWASKYGGKFFGLEGTADTRNVWQPRDNIQDSVGTVSAYFAYETYGSGSHCCWNNMYDPNAKNWKCTQGDLGTNIAWNTNHNNSMGSYVNGWSLFEWMLRQGDTTLIGTGNIPPSVNVGSDQVVYLPTDSVYVDATTSDSDGTIDIYAWTQISGPSSATIESASSEDTWFKDLIQGTYIFRLTCTDNDAGSSSDDVQITVNADTTTYPSPSGKKIVGNGEYQNLFIDTDGHLWGNGNVGNVGVNNSGDGAIPQRVLVTPLDLKFISAVGALHGAAAIDTAGYVWVTGDNDQYQHGIGNNSHPIYTPSKITVDSAGNPFNNIRSVVGYFVKDITVGYNGFYAIKNDGTLWGWGTMVKGMRGDSTAGDIKSRPVQIVMPGGRLVQQIIAGQFAIALCTDGTVWVWGEGASSNNLGYAGTTEEKWYPHQLSGLSNIKMIAGGLNWNYALDNNNVLYGWGAYGNYMGNANGLPIATPTVISNITNALPQPIDKIVTNSASTMVILQDSTLWGWGNAGQGTIGNGSRINFHIDGGNPFDRDNSIQLLPYHVANGILFDTIFGGSTYTYHWFARDKNDSLYSWGRGKAAVLTNGLKPATSNITASYGNSWDRAYPTPVDPFNVPASYISTSDYCVLVSSSGSPCNGYSIPANTAPVADAGSNQSLGDVQETTLDGTGSSDNVYVARYDWRQISGPNTAYIDLPASPTPRVFNLIEGTYVFELMVEDNGWFRDSTTVSITIGTQTNEPPVITALTSSADTIQLSTSSVDITFTATDLEGTVEKVLQVYASPGGSSVTVGTPASNVYPVTGMTVAGTYTFRAFATDENDVTVFQDIMVVVLPASSTGAAMTYKVNIYGGTNPQLNDNWNNWNVGTGNTTNQTINNIIDTTGAQSNISLTLTSQYSVVSNTFASASMATDTVILTSSYTTQARSIDGTGFEIGAKYTVIIYARRSGSNSTTYFTINGVQKSVLVYNNVSDSIVYTDIEITDGTLSIGITGSPNYISGLRIERQGESVPINIAPVADVDADIILIISPEDSVYVDGTPSTDSDGTIESYHWDYLESQVPIVIDYPDSSQTWIRNLGVGIYTFQLTVTDDQGATSTKNVTVTVLPEVFEHIRKFIRGRRFKL